MKFSIEEKESLVARYQAGESVREICILSNVPRSTFYTWIKPYLVQSKTTEYEVSYKAFTSLNRKIHRLEKIVEILQKVDCTVSSPLQGKLKALSKLYGQYDVRVLCDDLCVSRGTFYNHIFRRKDVTLYDKRRIEMKERIQLIFDESKQRFGANKILTVLNEQSIRTSYQYVSELMREMGIQSIVTTSKSDYKKLLSLDKKKNVLQRRFNVSKPNCVWVSDITCFKVNNLYIYVCVILDLFSRKVISYKVSSKSSTYLVTSTFKQAFSNRGNPQNLTFHSDQGCQYTSKAFRTLLKMNKIVQSFSRAGRPCDNAVAESFFALLKREEIYRTKYKSELQFHKSIDDYIEFYNSKRPHRTIHNKVPNKYEELYYKRINRE
ncbi:IS3 family transposase [Anaerorhabdus sp.]|uniref:IS3 family transposase n=1 Tax=Anaerorhabdus sp. TaxID=1872524 RepID=UPI002FCBD948